MSEATLTSKGQTTIPKPIRDYLQLRPGDRMEFMINEHGQVLVIPISVDAADLAGILPAPPQTVSIKQMNNAIRERGGKF